METISLWETGKVPGALGEGAEDTPTLTVYKPKGRASGASVVVCPGGGYGHLAPHEGEPVALWLNTLGITGFVLRYRLGPRYQHPVMGQDVARALRTVRARAGEWGLDANRIGVLGFSAGGHLASTAATHFDGGKPADTDPVERVSSRPNLAVLLYPVITLDGVSAHTGSRRNLLGPTPTPELIQALSNQNAVTAETPPAFLLHSTDDKSVPVENSLLFALALSRHKIPYAMQIYEHGGHGYGLGKDDPILTKWPAVCADWLKRHGFA